MQSNSTKRLRTLGLLAATLLLATGLAGCTAGGTITGAGASFANPVISLYAAEYEDATEERVSYNSIGSGGGIRAHIDKTVHFAASEAPLNDEQTAAAPGTLTLPFVIGTVAAAYNVQGVDDLRLTGEVLAEIYLGNINRWNDDRLVELNPDQNLPDSPITVAHRSDGSGTTFVFTNYLSKMSDEWIDAVGEPGYATSISWPRGTGGNGNEGVAGVIRNSPNSIGYIELSYAESVGLPVAAIENQEGEFIRPSLEAGTLAAAGAVADLPASHESWTGVSFTDAPGAGSYPIAAFSFYFLYEDLSVLSGAGVDKAFAQRIVDFIAWTITEGQQYNEQVQNAPIPEAVQKRNLEGLARVHYGGEPLEVRYTV